MMSPRDQTSSGLLAQALTTEEDADSLCALQAWAGASASYSQALDLLKSRAAGCRVSPPFYWYEDWDDEGLLAACRMLYKKAGCCMFQGRYDDAQRHSMAVLKAVGHVLEREGGWGRDVFGPQPVKALYRWGQALLALQHLAAAVPQATEAQAEALRGSAAADGRPLVDVPLPLPGALPTPAAAAALDYTPGAAVLCSSPDLTECTAGMLGPNGIVQLDRWHVVKGEEGMAPALPGRSALPRSVPIPFLADSARQQRRYLQPLAPLLAAYMAARWSQLPGAALPEAEVEEQAEEGSSEEDDGFDGL